MCLQVLNTLCVYPCVCVFMVFITNWENIKFSKLFSDILRDS